MNIESITIRRIASPLNVPFTTHLGTVKEREAIIVEARDADGRIGFGESDAFTSPWYTGETVATCWRALRDFLIPTVLRAGMRTPEALEEVLSGIRGNPMARSGISQSLWDLYARQKEVYLGRLFGSVRDKVASGAVIATSRPETAIEQIEKYAHSGYRRYKIKIAPGTDLALLSAIRGRFPDVELWADANAAYTWDDLDRLQALDAFQMRMIEQPLAVDDLLDHAALQAEIRTPICLDESIRSFQDTRLALKLGSCKVVNLKMARVGGWAQAVSIHDLCLKQKVPVWCGGMIEFGIAKAHTIALASLRGCSLPGDLVASSRYWKRDLVAPEIVVRDGYISVPRTAGIGFDVDRERLEALTQTKRTIRR